MSAAVSLAASTTAVMAMPSRSGLLTWPPKVPSTSLPGSTETAPHSFRQLEFDHRGNGVDGFTKR
jgi:hypothetical protein